MPQIDNASLALFNAMDDELKMKLARIADRDGKTVDELVNSFLVEGVSTYNGFISSFAG